MKHFIKSHFFVCFVTHAIQGDAMGPNLATFGGTFSMYGSE